MTLYMAFICIALAGSLSTRLSLRFFAFHLTGFLLVLLVVSMVRKYEMCIRDRSEPCWSRTPHRRRRR